MQVLLLEDVDNLGLAGSVVAVADGYGRNYLIPRGLAKVATKGALKQADQVRKSGERKRARQLAGAQALAKRIEDLALTFQARAGETGKLYGSITTGHLAEAMERELGQEIDRRKIITDPLRQLGEHTVPVRLMTDVATSFTVVIEPEEGELEDYLEVEADTAEEETAAEGSDQAETKAE
jgi:large subunit ribosomal protein L9